MNQVDEDVMLYGFHASIDGKRIDPELVQYDREEQAYFVIVDGVRVLMKPGEFPDPPRPTRVDSPRFISTVIDYGEVLHG